MPTVSSSQIRVTWIEPTDKGCPEITQYEVSYTGTSRHQDGVCSIADGTGSTTRTVLSYNIYSPQSYFSYNFTVKATGGSSVSLDVNALQLGKY